MPVFTIDGVSRSFAGTPPVHALSNVDLTIEAGEFVVLLGPSGCGKSTLLEILAGLQKPTAGEALFHDQPISGPGIPGLGVVFQDASLMPWRTVAANVSLGLEIKGQKKAAADRVVTST